MSFTEYDIAICGMAFTLPQGVNTPEAFTQLRESGASLVSDHQLAMQAETRDDEHFHCGFIDNLYAFPYQNFGLTKRQATLMDPQQRQLLILAKQALFDAQLPVASGNRIATLLASGINYYLLDNLLRHNADALDIDINQLVRLNDSSFTATRVASNLGLQGPAFTVQTACSSALTALHLGCQSLLSGESDAALVGACSLVLPQHRRFAIRDEDIIANDGVCRPLDEQATGTVASSGGIVFLLRPAQIAADEGRKIYAVVKATSVNNDGGGQASFGAPSVFGQQSVMEEALTLAQLTGDDLSLHELHGTATLLGDVIELQSTANALQLSSDAKLPLTAIKSQIGHTDSAAGLFGVLNCIAGLHAQTAPSMPNFTQLNPKLRDYFQGLANPSHAHQLSANSSENPRYRVGSVSSFGIGGSNGSAIFVVDDHCEGLCAPYEWLSFGEAPECFLPVTAETAQRNKAMPNDSQSTKTPLNAPHQAEPLGPSQLLPLLEGLLGEPIIDTNVNLFELGGDSILLLDVIDKLKHDHQLSLTLAELMDAASVAELMTHIALTHKKQRAETDSLNQTDDAINDRKIDHQQGSVCAETPMARAASLPIVALNEQQKRLWLAAKMQTTGDSLTISNLFELQTPISVTQLIQQLQRWVDQHPILNAILVEDDQLLGWQGREAPIPMHVNSHASHAVALGLIKSQLAQPIDLQGPLASLYLQPLRSLTPSNSANFSVNHASRSNNFSLTNKASGAFTPCTWLVGFAIHHAIIDGVTLRRLTAELASVFVQPSAL